MKKKDKLRILLKRVGREPQVEFIDDTLEEKQRLVNGLIEVVTYPLETTEDALIVCNEEGKILSLPPNTLFDFDYIAGDYFVIGDDYENGDFKSLSEDQILKYKMRVDKNSIIQTENKITAILLNKNNKDYER